jgi:hypothetical protein
MRHQSFERGDVLVIESFAIRGALNAYHGEAAIRRRQGSTQTFLQSQRTKELGEKYTRPANFVRQQPVRRNDRTHRLLHEGRGSGVERGEVALVDDRRFTAEYADGGLRCDIGSGGIKIDQCGGRTVEHRAKEIKRTVELRAVPHAQIERIQKLSLTVIHA